MTVCLRKSMPDMRAVPEEVDLAKNERCDFLPFMTPKQVRAAVWRGGDGRVGLPLACMMMIMITMIMM